MFPAFTNCPSALFAPSLFDSDSEEKHRQSKKLENDKAKKIQAAVLSMKSKYGKNTLVRGLSLQESAMTMTRNKQIGGHQA